jgi:hypothetical protein
VTRGVGILRLHGGVQALDRLDGALLEHVVGLAQGGGALAEGGCLPAQHSGGISGEEHEENPQDGEEHGARNPDRLLALGDGGFERLGIRVDLIGADHFVLAGEKGRVDLDDFAGEECGLGRFLLPLEPAELCACLPRLENLTEIGAEREFAPDPVRVEVRPLERPVRVLDLDAEDVRALGEVAVYDRGCAVADLERRAVDHAGAEHARLRTASGSASRRREPGPAGAREE